MCVIRAGFAVGCVVFVVFLGKATSVLSASVPSSGHETLCRVNCGASDLLGDDHTVVKKESADRLNSTDSGKMFEEDYFDGLISLLTPGRVNQGAENTIEQPARVARLLRDAQPEDVSGDNSLEDSEFTPRSPRRKIWMAALAGIVLKLASLLPLILGKLSLIGITALLTSKLSLLIVTIIVLRGMFTSDKGHGYPEAGFTSPSHYGYQQDYHQGVAGYQGVSGYQGMAQSGPSHRRWAYYRGAGRELGSWEDELEENKKN